MNPQRRLACAAGLSFLVAGLTGCDEDPLLAVGDPIRHDDFLYTVLVAQRVDAIGSRPARGQFLVVHFAVANRAIRVSHAWTNRIAYLVDADGRRHENDDTLQQQLDGLHPFGWAAEYVTAPGAKRSTMLVFELPADVARPLDLMVRGELLMGDVLGRGTLPARAGAAAVTRAGSPVWYIRLVCRSRLPIAGSRAATEVQPMYRIARVVALVAVSFSLAAPGPAIAQEPSADVAAVRAVVASYVDAREKRDATALAALFTDDADQLVSSGEWRRGRDAVVSGGLASSARTSGARTIEIETVRFVSPDVAVADGRYEIAAAAGTPARQMWTTFVMARRAGTWRISAIRNMRPTE